jgi:hypothetical protein
MMMQYIILLQNGEEVKLFFHFSSFLRVKSPILMENGCRGSICIRFLMLSKPEAGFERSPLAPVLSAAPGSPEKRGAPFAARGFL